MTHIVPGNLLDISDEELAFSFNESDSASSPNDQSVPDSKEKNDDKKHRKCSGPGCTSTDNESLTFHRFPKNESKLRRWIGSFPNVPWKFVKSGRLCEKHFEKSCYKVVSTDTNPWRKKSDALKKPELLPGALPTIWPDVPKELWKEENRTVPRPTNLSTASDRRQSYETSVKEKDQVNNFQELLRKKFKLPDGCIRVVDESSVAFLKMITTGEPRVKYCLKIFSNLEYEIWHSSRKISLSDLVENIEEASDILSNFSKIQDIITALENKHEETNESATTIDIIIEKLEQLYPGNKKVIFLSEQLRLLTRKPGGRRYSSDLLAKACMWRTTSPALYRLILADDVLTLPGEKYVSRLSDAVKIDLELSDATIAYLKARKQKLSARECNVNVILDEVHSAQTVDYSNGKFFGIEHVDMPTKRLLCVMLKSVAGPFMDVIAMSPMTDTSAEVVHKVWLNVIKVSTELDFNVVVKARWIIIVQI